MHNNVSTNNMLRQNNFNDQWKMIMSTIKNTCIINEKKIIFLNLTSIHKLTLYVKMSLQKCYNFHCLID